MKDNYTVPVIMDDSDPEIIEMTFPTLDLGNNMTCVPPDEHGIDKVGGHHIPNY